MPASTFCSPSKLDLGKLVTMQGGPRENETVLLRGACPQQAVRAACGILRLLQNQNEALEPEGGCLGTH